MGKPIITNCETFFPTVQLFILEKALHVYHMVDKLYVQELFYNDFLNPYQ